MLLHIVASFNCASQGVAITHPVANTSTHLVVLGQDASFSAVLVIYLPTYELLCV